MKRFLYLLLAKDKYHKIQLILMELDLSGMQSAIVTDNALKDFLFKSDNNYSGHITAITTAKQMKEEYLHLKEIYSKLRKYKK